jgi:hypothetical protein
MGDRIEQPFADVDAPEMVLITAGMVVIGTSDDDIEY